MPVLSNKKIQPATILGGSLFLLSCSLAFVVSTTALAQRSLHAEFKLEPHFGITTVAAIETQRDPRIEPEFRFPGHDSVPVPNSVSTSMRPRKSLVMSDAPSEAALNHTRDAVGLRP